MKRKILVCVLALTMLVTMLAGCGSASKEEVSKPVKDSITLTLDMDVGNLDPINSVRANNNVVFYNVYNALVGIDKDGKVAPELAENWTVSDDGITYTFNLRKGVKFHNGEELKANDAIYTLQSSQKSPYSASFVEDIKEIVPVDDYSFKVVLKSPSAAFLLNLRLIFIVNEKAVKDAAGKYGEDNAIGTGAYKFVKHVTGQSVTLERNENYFGTKPQIKNVEVKIITDANASLIALQTGEVDLLPDIQAISVGTIKNNSKLALHKYNSLNLQYIQMNLTKKPFDNKLVRQAVNYAIDKDAVVQLAADGLGEKAALFIDKNTFGFTDKVKGYECNIEKAKELLAQAGYPNGFKVTIKTMAGDYKKAAEVVQESLSKIGITASIEMGESNAFISDLLSGNYEMGSTAIGLLADLDFWSLVFSSKGAYNMAKYNNSKIDELFAKGKKLIDNNERLVVYQELLQIINDDAVIAPLYFPIKSMATQKDLKIEYIEPGGIFKIENMSWTK